MKEEVYAGSIKAIWYELRHGDVFTLIDEVWHTWVFDWILPGLHFRFCQWTHLRKYNKEKKE